MIVCHIQLPKKQDAAAFVAFMRDAYFPAIRKGQTRVGQVTTLQLLARVNEHEGDNNTHEFFWHVGWSGLPTDQVRVDDEGIAHKLEAFGAVIKHLGYFEEVAVWPKPNPG